MGDSQFRNQATVIGTLQNVNMKPEVGQNGLGELSLKADGNDIKINLWGKQDGSTEKFIMGLDEDERYEAKGEVDINITDDGGKFLSVQPYTTNGITPSNEEEDAVAIVAGDIFDWDLEYDANGDPQGEVKLMVYNTYNRDGGNFSKDEVLKMELENQIEYLKKEYPDKPTKGFEDTLKELKADGSTMNCIEKYKEVIENTKARLFKIDLLTIDVEGQTAERMANEGVAIGDNITLGTVIIDQMVTDRYGMAKGNERGLKAEMFYGINESAGADSVVKHEEEDTW